MKSGRRDKGSNSFYCPYPSGGKVGLLTDLTLTDNCCEIGNQWSRVGFNFVLVVNTSYNLLLSKKNENGERVWLWVKNRNQESPKKVRPPKKPKEVPLLLVLK